MKRTLGQFVEAIVNALQPGVTLDSVHFTHVQGPEIGLGGEVAGQPLGGYFHCPLDAGQGYINSQINAFWSELRERQAKADYQAGKEAEVVQ